MFSEEKGVFSSMAKENPNGELRSYERTTINHSVVLT